MAGVCRVGLHGLAFAFIYVPGMMSNKGPQQTPVGVIKANQGGFCTAQGTAPLLTF